MTLEGPPLGERYRTRTDSADYLTTKLGRKVTVGALHRHASDGTGPRYVMILGRASYRTEWLDAWVESLVQQPAERRRRASPGAERATPAAKADSRSRQAERQPRNSTFTTDPGPAAPEIEPGASTITRKPRRGRSTHAT
jgi:hypothetical protein